MSIRLALAAGLLLLGAVPARAGGDHDMLAAEQELKIARDHLQAAGPDYGGHRRAAIDHLDEALHEIHEGIKLSRSEGGAAPRGRERAAKHPPREPAAEPDED